MSEGIQRCIAAFDRLKLGQPQQAKHVGLAPDKISAAVVSAEAGFDSGYLKRSRRQHLPLILQIEAYRKAEHSASSSTALQLRRAKSRVSKASAEVDAALGQLAGVLAQNLKLVERVRVLELELKKHKIVVPIS